MGGCVPGLYPGGGHRQRPRLPHQAPRLLAGLPLPLGLATLRQGQRIPHNQCCGSGIRCLFDSRIPGFGMSNKSGSGSGRNNPDHISETIFGLNYLLRIRDPGWEKFGSEIRDGKIWIRDKHPGSATLPVLDLAFFF